MKDNWEFEVLQNIHACIICKKCTEYLIVEMNFYLESVSLITSLFMKI